MLRDIRRAPFCWQAKDALGVLRRHYAGALAPRRSTALALYLVLTEVASDQYRQDAAAAFVPQLAALVGASDRTVQRYLRDFEALGLVAVERRVLDGRVNAANVYHLLTVGDGGTGGTGGDAAGGARGRAGATTGGAGAALNQEPPLNNGHEEDRLARLRAVERRSGLDPAAFNALAREVAAAAEDDGRFWAALEREADSARRRRR